VARADLAEREAEVADRLHAQGLIPEADERRARAAAEEHRAAAEARRRSLERLSLDRRGDQSEKEALLAGLDRQMASLRARQEVLQATRARLRFELEQHLIRAPVAGVLGEVVPLQPGAVVEKGARLGAVVPAGSTRIVAEFTPPEALGRVAPGQRGRLRLRGFPWVQYGTVRATVERVASESGRGDVRVELLVDRAASFPVPLHHGFPGDLEIEVESVSPANLVLRAAGRLLTLRAGGGRSVRTGS
jgi:membrane fusion protein (multidrug efflux system)